MNDEQNRNNTHEKDLENAYREANNEIDDLWNALIADGLENEMW